MKKIAVITGASSGIGRRFTETIGDYGAAFDEIWVIARRADRLQELTAPYPIRPVPLDLTNRASFDTYKALLEQEQPDVALLINCSGFGKFAAVEDTPLATDLNMVDLNCQAVMALCQLTLPFMHRARASSTSRRSLPSSPFLISTSTPPPRPLCCISAAPLTAS